MLRNRLAAALFSSKSSLVGVITLAALLVSPLVAQERGKGPQVGRVAGISVTVDSVSPNGPGRDVDFLVQMTTTNSTLKSNQRGVSFTPSETSSTLSGSAGLGDLNSYFRYHASGSESFSGQNFLNQTSGGNSTWFGDVSGTLLEVTWRRTEYQEGYLPGIDFGDGATVQATQLSTLYSQSTVPTFRGNPRVVKRWRGSFSHTYGDQQAVQMTVASRCCALFSSDRGTPTTIFTGSVAYAPTPNSLNGTWQTRDTSVFQNPSAGSINYSWDRGNSTGTFRRAETDSFTGLEYANQLVNTAQLLAGGGANVLEIPTVGSVGLALLSGLLLIVGVGILRR